MAIFTYFCLTFRIIKQFIIVKRQSKTIQLENEMQFTTSGLLVLILFRFFLLDNTECESRARVRDQKGRKLKETKFDTYFPRLERGNIFLRFCQTF